MLCSQSRYLVSNNSEFKSKFHHLGLVAIYIISLGLIFLIDKTGEIKRLNVKPLTQFLGHMVNMK